jgi:hypothetical protein
VYRDFCQHLGKKTKKVVSYKTFYVMDFSFILYQFYTCLKQPYIKLETSIPVFYLTIKRVDFIGGATRLVVCLFLTI